jgi:hypothetical protein
MSSAAWPVMRSSPCRAQLSDLLHASSSLRSPSRAGALPLPARESCHDYRHAQELLLKQRYASVRLSTGSSAGCVGHRLVAAPARDTDAPSADDRSAG